MKNMQLNNFGPGAEVRVTKLQFLGMVAVVVTFFAVGILLRLTPEQYMQTFVASATIFFAVMLCFTAYVASAGIREDSVIKISNSEAKALRDFPFVSVIIPMYKEKSVAGQILKNLKKLRYPLECVEFIIVLEEDDADTRSAFENTELPCEFRVVVRPRGSQGRKPGALNYILWNYLSSESQITTVFDAEDQPDPWQIHKAVIGFYRAWESDDRVAVIQSQLQFTQNENKNWITRMLGLDYRQHFGLILPGLTMRGLISPLGGTSNYILTAVLRELGGWDPLHVTEDLDLAVKLARLGYKVRVIDSVTAEEAVTTIGDFIPQRSRWIKGGLQTWFIHMRNPFRLYRELGFKGFIGFQLIVGAPLVLYAINLIFWGMTLTYALTKSEFIQSLFPPFIFYVAMVCFAVGNYMHMYLLQSAAFKTKKFGSVVYALFAFPYWVMLSIAGLKAYWEFTTSKKSNLVWRKTEHRGQQEPKTSIQPAIESSAAGD